jgi:hypothetical protein
MLHLSAITQGRKKRFLAVGATWSIPRDVHRVTPGHSHKRRSLAVGLLLAVCISCHSNHGGNRGRVQQRTRDGDAVAWVGESPISVATLQRASRSLPDAAASVLDRLIEARTLGLFAERGGLERGRRQMVLRAVLARALLERIEEQTKRPVSPTDDEVEAMTSKRWIEFDRPEARRTCHAVVHSEELAESAGNVLAERLASALRPLSDCAAFLERAKAFPVAGAKITAEELPPVTSDGRTLLLDAKGEPVDEGSPFDADFARAVFQIGAVGAQSGIAKTRFGWHVILLEGQIAAKHVPLEERRRLLADDILHERAKDASLRRIAESRKNEPIAVERASVAAIGRVQVAP